MKEQDELQNLMSKSFETNVVPLRVLASETDKHLGASTTLGCPLTPVYILRNRSSVCAFAFALTPSSTVISVQKPSKTAAVTLIPALYTTRLVGNQFNAPSCAGIECRELQ